MNSPEKAVTQRVVGIASMGAGLALNPYLVARLVYGIGTGGPREMHAALWIVTAVLVSFGALVLAGKVRVGPRLSKVILALLAAVATVLLLVVADRVVGKVRGKPAIGLIFPPSSEVGYDTPEFRVVVKSNSLGFRGEEVPAAKGSAYRIVAIGDSFTMGWGLDQQDTWTALLQKRLQGGGEDVEVLNLGQGGADAEVDARNAAKAIPVLKPDLVIVGLLQGDDLFQIVERMKRGDAPPVDLSRWERSLGGSMVAFLRGRMFPNLLSSTLKTTVTENWKETAARIQENLTPEQRRRFDHMDGAARNAFLAGGLNPIVVQSAILFPDYYVRHLDPTEPETRRGTERTAECLREIAGVAARHGAQVVVTVVPYRAYVSVRDCDALRRLGFAIPASLALSNAATQAIRDASELAGIYCIDLTHPIREACRTRNLYYGMDGHFNPAGAALFAEYLADAVREYRSLAASRAGR
jgi:lysophospholipase L1-like esterase